MFTGLMGLPFSAALYRLILRPKKDDLFPKRGLLRLTIAAAVSVILSSVLSVPLSALVALIRSGAFSDIPGLIELLIDLDAFRELINATDGNCLKQTIRSVTGMFFSAGLLEEGFKYLTCRIAVRKEGMIRTWMDAVIAFEK